MATIVIERELVVPWSPGPAIATLAPGGARLGVRHGSRLAIHATDAGLELVHELTVPGLEAASTWAIDATGRRLAMASASAAALTIVAGDGSRVEVEMPDGIAAPQQLAFDAAGQHLWASTELGEDPASPVLVTHVHRFDAADGRSKGRCAVRIDLADQDHRLVPRPDGCVLRISCGQDGAWLHLVDADGGSDALQSHPLAVGGGVGDLLDVAGFSADGSRLAVLADDRLACLAWPSAEAIGDVAFPPDYRLSQFGDAVDDLAYAPVARDAEPGVVVVVVDLRRLVIVAQVALDDDEAFVGAAPGGHLVTAARRGDQLCIRLRAIRLPLR